MFQSLFLSSCIVFASIRIYINSIKWFLFLSKQYLFKINKIEKLGLELKLYIFIYQYYIHNLLHFDPSFF